jgi:hypothetical protein
VADGGPVDACVPESCQEQGVNCGFVPDSCGGLVNCGTCPAGQVCGGNCTTCGGGGQPYVCGGGGGCCPKTCADQGANCGMIGDGCGNILDCGTCPGSSPCFTCGGGGIPNQCGSPPCMPKTCPEQGFNCGTASDGCCNVINCGTCPTGQTCGGAGQSNVCG